MMIAGSPTPGHDTGERMPTPTRIRLVSAVYPRPRKPESGRFTGNLAEGWSARGIAIDVVTPSTLSERLSTLRRRPEDVSFPGVTVRVVRTLGSGPTRLLPSALRRWLKTRDVRLIGAAMQAGEPPDLIFAEFAAAGSHARKAAQTFGVPYVVALGESYSLVTGSDAFVAENRQVLCGAIGVVCVSPRLRDEAIHLGADPGRVALIPNVPIAGRFRPMNKADCRRELGLDPEAFLVAYVGHFIERKGAPRLNQALHRMRRPAQAAFLGSGPLAPDFPGVIHTGSVSHDRLAVWLNAADVLALPTLAEGGCNAIAEALACALPLVSSDIPDVRWQVPEAGALLVDPRDPGALAAALDALAGNPARLAAMRSALLALAERDAGRDRPAEILTWMQGLMARPPVPASSSEHADR